MSDGEIAQVIDVRKFIEMIDDEHRLAVCKYAYSRLTQESKDVFLHFVQKQEQSS